MIRFVPETNRPGTDASYHLPAFYELWARWGPKEDRAFWARAAEVSRELFLEVTGPTTGLSPDRSNFDMSPMLRDGQPVPFGYDSWRTVSNWSVDYSWWGKDPRERTLSDRVQKLPLQPGDPPLSRSLHPGWQTSVDASFPRHGGGRGGRESGCDTRGDLQGIPAGAVGHAGPSGEQRYYDGMLYLMSLMHLSGEFRIIEPGSAQ